MNQSGGASSLPRNVMKALRRSAVEGYGGRGGSECGPKNQ